jgi:GAF domain-containing protein
MGPPDTDPRDDDGDRSGVTDPGPPRLVDGLDSLLDAVPAGVAIATPDGSTLYVNRRLAALLDRPRAAVAALGLDHPDWGFTDGDGRHGVTDDHPLARVLATGEPSSDVVHDVRHSDGTRRRLSSDLSPLRSPDGEVTAVVVGTRDVTERARLERRLRWRRAEAARLDRVSSVVRGVAADVSRARTRTDLERATCDRIADSEPYLLAVLGTFSAGNDEFVPRAAAGVDEASLEALLDAAAAPPLDDGPAAVAARTGTVQAVQNVTDLPYAYWSQAAERYGFRSFASVPLVHDDVVLGVLGVYARDPGAFGARERTLLAELGETVGYGLRAVESAERLRSEQVVELTLRTASLAGPTRADDEGGFRATGEGVLEPVDGVTLGYFVVAGASRADAVERADRFFEGEVRPVAAEDDEVRVEVRSAPDSPSGRLAARDGELASVVVEDGAATLGVRLPRSADREAAVEDLRELVPDLAVVADRLVYTPRSLRPIAESLLTERQLTTVELAYHAGYFRQPRTTSGAALAERMGVTATTVHRHLRNAEARLFEALFDASALPREQSRP